MVSTFLIDGTFYHRLNETTIVLVPKKAGPVSIKDYRPISLWNVASKIISEILVQRLHPIISKIISPTQEAFVLGRRAVDQIVEAKEMVHGMSKLKGTKSLVTIKLDVEKAYDTIS